MAGGKKKKKAAGNTGRGFATTSTPSKSKPLEQAPAFAESTDAIENSQPTVIPSPPEETQQIDRELHQLTPEELEHQLEESDLQLLVEKHREKSRKDAAHQASRLITEKRLLRSQAENLTVRSWLPDEMIVLIQSFVEADFRESKPLAEATEEVRAMKGTPEDETVTRLWTLEQALIQMRFSSDQARNAIRDLVRRERSGKPVAAPAKDSIWGLTECLDWMALTYDASQLPHYESKDSAIRSEVPVRSTETQKLKDSDTPDSTPPISRSLTPPQTENAKPITPEYEECDESNKQISESGSDTDDDPIVLTAKYLALKKRLYEVRPGLAESSRKASAKRSTSMKSKANSSNPNPQVARLQRKLSEIESDILFDRDEAESQWIETRNALAKEESERRRLQLSSNAPKIPNAPILPPSTPSTTDSGGTEANADDPGIDSLADMFASADGELRVTSQQNAAADKLVTIQDFGKFSGLKPRRVLEEACKARDSGSQAIYRVISSNPFNIRHSVVVRWSRDQPVPVSMPITTVTCEADERHVKIEMDFIATPDAGQSEAYVSTVALFHLFAAFPKEEKVYLRLPAVWRDLWTELSVARKEESDASDRNTLRELRKVVSGDEEQPQTITRPKVSDEDSGTTQKIGIVASREVKSWDPPTNISQLMNLWASKASAPSFQRMLKLRQSLPIWKFKDDLLEAIESNQTIIICGETGCGKSTQVPSFILEHELVHGRSCKVYCTEPRRISAISLARRVCEELGEKKGDVGTARSLVGYAIRLESKVTPHTRLVYATTGIIMRMLERANDLDDITHLILDEVHERTIDSDFLLIILRKLMVRRPSLRVVLMSATVNAQRFSKYLDGAPILTVPGRTFPVETRYLEDAVELTRFHGSNNEASSDVLNTDEIRDGKQDTALKMAQSKNLEGYSVQTRDTLASFDEYQISYELIVKLIETIAASDIYEQYSKAVLVFLPGIAEIRRLHAMILGSPIFSSGWQVYPLHSTIATEEQEHAFLVPPEGTRKIVIATNIAETGITIPDVTCVIDTGKHKEMRFDERRQLSRLIESFISRANAKQRRGRAGRVQNGLCYHLFTKARHDSMMAEEQVPEMLRLSLQDLVLRVKICNLGNIEETLSDALDPPSSKNVRRAIDSLVDVKALTALEDLTPLGRQLAKLPLDVFLGKLILLGSIFQCLDGALTVAAILSSKSPFAAPMGSRSQVDLARLAFKRSDSDVLTVYNAYCAWRYICSSKGMPEYQFCRKNCLSQQTLSNIEDLKAQLTSSLAEAGFIHLSGAEKAALNRVQSSRGRHFVELPVRYGSNDDNDLVLHSVLGWSFYPKLLKGEGKGWRNVANNQSVSLAPTSVNKGPGSHPKWLSFYHIMQSSNKFYNAHETSSIEDFAIALVCGDAEFRMYSGVIVIDGHRIRFCVDDWKSMLVLKYLRTHIRQIMSQAFRSPGRELTAQQQAWFDIWQKMFSQRNQDRK